MLTHTKPNLRIVYFPRLLANKYYFSSSFPFICLTNGQIRILHIFFSILIKFRSSKFKLNWKAMKWKTRKKIKFNVRSHIKYTIKLNKNIIEPNKIKVKRFHLTLTKIFPLNFSANSHCELYFCLISNEFWLVDLNPLIRSKLFRFAWR